MKIRDVAKNVWAIDGIVDSQETMDMIMDEFDHNLIRFNKVEKHDTVPKNAPRWSYLAKGGDRMLGDNTALIRLGEKYKYVAKKILKRDLWLTRVNTNIQLQFQDTTFHMDGGDNSWTLLVFAGDCWDSNWGGEFVCKTEETYVSVPYIPANGALFRGDMEHRGCGPNGLAELPRSSIAFTYIDSAD